MDYPTDHCILFHCPLCTTEGIALEEALSRHAELQRDEEWKRANCRECPRCQRVVEKLEGCDQMICGQDAHGGNRQNGCGHHFSWNEARAYRGAPESRPLPQLNVEEVRLRGANLRHPFTHCSSCEQDIVGPRFRCIHCPDYNLCVTCERECATCATHPLNHVFEICSRLTMICVLTCHWVPMFLLLTIRRDMVLRPFRSTKFARPFWVSIRLNEVPQIQSLTQQICVQLMGGSLRFKKKL